MSYVPVYSEVKEEIVSVTLNLSNYVTQKEFKNVTNVNTSDFALKNNVADIRKKVDDTAVDKINDIDELQGKNYVEDNYLYFSQKYEYVKTNNSNNFLSRRSSGISNEKFEPLEQKNTPITYFNKVLPYLKIESFEFLAQKKITYTQENIVNTYIAYSMPDITYAKGSDLV